MIRVRSLALVSALLATGVSAQAFWLDEIRELDGRGRTREALARLESDPARLATDAGARLLRGVLLAKLGRTDEARELYQRLVLDQPDLPEAYNNLAVMHAAAGDYDTAIEMLKQGLATNPSYRTTYDNLTKVYGKLAGDAYSKALGDERIEAEPLRLALINGLAEGRAPVAAMTAAPRPPVPAAAAPARPAGEPPPPQVPETLPPPPPTEPALATDEEIEREIWQTVQAWANAWSGQQPDGYLGFYGREFTPPDGSSRADWEALRRRRLTTPEFINISLAKLDLRRPAPDRAVARFVQSYESDRFQDTVTKALELARTGAGWRIVAERLEDSP